MFLGNFFLVLILIIFTKIVGEDGSNQYNNVGTDDEISIITRRCWYVNAVQRAVTHPCSRRILAILQRSYVPIISLDKDGDLNRPDYCDGHIFINTKLKDTLQMLSNLSQRNNAMFKNKKMMFVHLSDQIFTLEESTLIEMHDKALNVLIVGFDPEENKKEKNMISTQDRCSGVSIYAPLINKTLRVSKYYKRTINKLYQSQKWRPDFSEILNKTVRVAMLKGINFTPYLTTDENGRDGIEYRIIQEVSKGWKVQFDEKLTPKEIRAWAFLKSVVVTNNADLVTASFSLSFNNMGNDISTPYGRTCGSFLVPKALPVNPSQYLILPLGPYVWVTFGTSVIIAALCMYFMAHFGSKTISSQWVNSHFNLLSNCILITVSIATSHCSWICPHQHSLRILLMSWILVCLVVSVAYSTGYTSLLTYPRFSRSIDTFKDMIDNDIYWGFNGTLEVGVKEYVLEGISPYLPEISKRFKPESGLYERFKRIEEGNYALLILNSGNKYATHAEPIGNVSMKFRALKECISEYYIALPLQKNSPLTHIFNTKISKLIESGIIDHWFRDIIMKNKFHFMNGFFSDVLERNDIAPLTLEDLQGVFYLLGVSLFFSTVVFLYELWKYYGLKCIFRK